MMLHVPNLTREEAKLNAARKERCARIEMAADRARWNAKTKADLARVSVQDDAVAICHAPEPVTAPAKREPWFRIIGMGAPSIREIRQVVGDYYGLTVHDMTSVRRKARLVRGRHVAMYMARILTNRSYPEIGRLFGDIDHTSVMFAVKKIEKLLDADPDIAREIAELKDRIGAL